jgi:hypothetical protein
MNRKSGIIAIGSLLIGFLIGTSTLGTASAEESPTVAALPQGDLLKVCIDKKSGAIRAATKCKNTEKPYSLGGPGPQGPKGDQGVQGEQGTQGIQGVKGDTGSHGIQGIQGEKGIQGDRGLVGQTGATGTVSGLSSKRISYVAEGSGCYPSFSAVTAASLKLSWAGLLEGLNTSTKTFSICTVSVYAP